MKDAMINPSILDLLKRVDNKYTLVTLASKRARQLIEGAKPLIDIDSTKPVTIATNEIDQGAITYTNIKEGLK
jgi:DNA-directed RNA polymerase subunit omega